MLLLVALLLLLLFVSFRIGVEGPVPLLFCLSMPKAEVVRFFPWGALAINGEVVCEPPSKSQGTHRQQQRHQPQLYSSSTTTIS